MSEKEIDRKWHLIDLEGATPGRISTVIAGLLMGKGKVKRVPNIDGGDYVVAINAAKLKISPRRMAEKVYYSYSGYPGGLKAVPIARMFKERPERIIELAVKNMLPKSKLQDQMMARLYVCAESQHKHEAQKPQPYKISYK